MSDLNYSQSLQLLGPYYIAPGEPAGLGWYYEPGGQLASFATLQTNTALNKWFVIENTAMYTEGPDTEVSPTLTQYYLNVTNNAPAEAGAYVEVFLVVQSLYF